MSINRRTQSGAARYLTHTLVFFRTQLWVWPLFVAGLARGDVLVCTNGERFVGTAIEQTNNNVVFESELAGRLTFSQSEISELKRTPMIAAANTTNVMATPNAATNTAAWKPPGVGNDGADWVQLTSGEWLRGQLKYIQNKEVEFESDEMDEQTLKLEDVSQVFTTHRVYTKFDGLEPAYGKVVISNELVMVDGPVPLALPRDLLIGLTPSGRNGIREWSGDFNLALSLQSGNNHQTDVTAMGELGRRTPGTTLLFDYLGNYGQSDGVENANNNRFNATYDLRLNRDWFVRAAQLEYYQDSLANIDYRLTGGVGAGYYIFDRTGLEWIVSAGPGYQYTKFSTVVGDQSETADTLAGVLNSRFDMDVTKRLTLIQTWQSMFIGRDSGKYNHHTVSTLEFEVKRHVNLDVSLVWDYLMNPQVKSSGVMPQKSDLYLTVGLGLRF